MRNLAFLFCFITCSIISYSQDIQYSNINDIKLYINPGFAGKNNIPNAVIGHRNFSPSGFGDYLSYFVSYQQKVDILQGGIGLQLINDRQGSGAINRIYSGGMYAYHFNITDNLMIQAGLEGKFAHLSYDIEKIILPDMFNPITWQGRESDEDLTTFAQNTANYLEFNTGFVITYKNVLLRKYREFSLGISVHHINKPPSLLSGDKIPRRYNLYFDIDIPLMDFRSKQMIPVLKPVFLYQVQDSEMTFNYGGYLSVMNFQIGVLFRHNQNFGYFNSIFYAGVNFSDININYSYDSSFLGKMKKNPVSGAHEVTLSLNFQYKRNE